MRIFMILIKIRNVCIYFKNNNFLFLFSFNLKLMFVYSEGLYNICFHPLSKNDKKKGGITMFSNSVTVFFC